MKYILIAFIITCTPMLAAKLDSNEMNMDAVYNRPFLMEDNLFSMGGYIEAHYFRAVENGISEGHSFNIPRLTLFASSSISKDIKFLTEIEFEEGGNEIAIEFAALDFIFAEQLVLRGGIIMNPIGAFNQNHDGPKWEFISRPLFATEMLPATWSNVGAGIYGKKWFDDFAIGYELYFTNGFDESIIDNDRSKTFLPASKSNFERFEENHSGELMTTGKLSFNYLPIGEIGFSYMGGQYNLVQTEGINFAEERNVHVVAVNFDSEIELTGTRIIAEAGKIFVDVPNDYSLQFGNEQTGGFLDIVQQITTFDIFNFENTALLTSIRLDYIDWNEQNFPQTGGEIGDEITAITGAISLRPNPGTVIRLNYQYLWQTDFIGNPPSETNIISLGLSSYF